MIEVEGEMHGKEVSAIIYDKKSNGRVSVKGVLSVDGYDMYICYDPLFMYASVVASKKKPPDKLGKRYSFYLGNDTIFIGKNKRLERFAFI